MVRAVFLSFFAIALLAVVVEVKCEENGPMSCDQFRSIMSETRTYVQNRDSFWDQNCPSYADNIFGAAPTYDTCSIATGNIAELHTYAAQKFSEEYNIGVGEYQSLVETCNVIEPKNATCKTASAPPPVYRPVDGRGNNYNNPEYGASDTPFARFGKDGYQDGINMVRKAKSGADLPNPRSIVQNALTQAVRSDPPPLSYGDFALATVLFITHDVHYQTAVQPKNAEEEIQCCSAGNAKRLAQNESHPSCFPIEVDQNDSVFGSQNIGCMNLVRSERSEYTDKVQPGEIMNRATSYLDLSLIYGNHESEQKPIRSGEGGKLRMGNNNVLPVDANQKHIPSMRRFTMVPFASIWPALFSRNHNYLADELARLNPCWKDEKLFQEARRINIATFQYNLITSKAVEASISNIPINETYSPDRNAATCLEFAIAYRMAHYYLHDDMIWIDENGNNKTMKQSDTIGHIEYLEGDFDGALRGTLNRVVNAGPYGDEIINRIGKTTPSGYGADIIAIDIQRARDQGLPSYLSVRRQCNLKPEINSFDDMYKNNFLAKHNIDLLNNTYGDAEDIDYYVGGIFETYEKIGNPLVGPTFGCVIAHQWDNFAGGDIYYYSNPNSPYPFSNDQINAIHAYNISSLLCVNSGMSQTAAFWPYAPHPDVNPLRNCTDFPVMNLSAWKADCSAE